MHALRLGVALLMFGLLAGQEVRAGVYNLDEPKSGWAVDLASRERGNPVPWTQVRNWRAELAGVLDAANPEEPAKDKEQPKTPPKPKSELRLAYEKQVKELEQLQKEGKLTPSERVSLSGCQLRMGRWREARTLLEQGLRTLPQDEPTRFLLLLNLAATYENDDPALGQRAIDHQVEALRNWPARCPEWKGWNPATWEWYRWAETYNLKLMSVRQRDTGGPNAAPYALFPRVRFTGPSGKYEAGSIALEQWNELPRDAERLVAQLMVWQPLDNRLYWLYGELLNARGEVPGAYEVLDGILRSGLGDWTELRRHRSVLREAKENQKGSEEQTNFTPPPPPASSLPDWRALATGFLVGVVVAVLAVFQLKEWRRRSPAPVAEPPGSPGSWDRSDHAPPLASPAPEGPGAASVTRPEQG